MSIPIEAYARPAKEEKRAPVIPAPTIPQRLLDWDKVAQQRTCGGVVGSGYPIYGPISGTVNVEYVSDLLGEAFRQADQMRLAREWAEDLFGRSE